MAHTLKIPAATELKFKKIGLIQPFDFVLHLPIRYEDETKIIKIAELEIGQTAQIEGEIIFAEISFRPRKSLICQLKDETGIIFLRFLNIYPSQEKQLGRGKKVRILGEVREGYYGLEMIHPKCHISNENIQLKQSLTPIYPTTAGLSQSTLRKYILVALKQVKLNDTLKESIKSQLKLEDFASSVETLHNPKPDENRSALLERSHPAWKRIKFDELLAQQLSMRKHYQKRQNKTAPVLLEMKLLTEKLLKILPFELTEAQRKVWKEIKNDLLKTHPMQRLLQGDVGSGKTIVAALAALQSIENSYQVALMAPTEILAEQHYIKLREWLKPLGISPVWLTGSLKKKEKNAAIEQIALGKTQLAIGTHALFQASVTFNKLGLIIVDEQHKFGVQQRLALREKGKDTDTQFEPHQLMMSATPIPRTLAMSYYADLDVSVIDQLPPGRTPVITKLINEKRRQEVTEKVRQACLKKQQAYWVCPLIDESETLQLQTAIETRAALENQLPELSIGLVHGKLDNAEKAKVMAEFKAGQIQLLVATTVIEVGVDVPNASLMVIEHAERMGLAQLHQLRGRVGRGAAESMCVLLFQQPLSQLARARLKVIYESTDGFEIAQQDMQLRGPGELLGARQSGVPMLRFADLNEDAALLEVAQKLADELLKNDPETATAHLQRWMANKPDFLNA